MSFTKKLNIGLVLRVRRGDLVRDCWQGLLELTVLTWLSAVADFLSGPDLRQWSQEPSGAVGSLISSLS